MVSELCGASMWFSLQSSLAFCGLNVIGSPNGQPSRPSSCRGLESNSKGEDMENSAYMPNPLVSPALMVLASSAETPREAPRIPAHHDLHGPYGTGSFSLSPIYRQNDGYANLPGHLIHMHPPPFVHPNIDRGGLINPSGGGAFRPVASAGEDRDNYHSAFTPAKRPKPSSEDLKPTPSQFSPVISDNGTNYVNNYESKPSTSATLSIKEESSEKEDSRTSEFQGDCLSVSPPSEGGESNGRTTPDEGRSLRKQRKRNLLDGQLSCPICGLSLWSGDLQKHLESEVEKLNKISRKDKKTREVILQAKKSTSSNSYKKSKDSPGPSDAQTSSESTYESFLKLRANRQARLNARSSKGKKKKSQEEAVCPVCNEKQIGTGDEITNHVEQCLRKQSSPNSIEDEPVDVEGDLYGEVYEEYTWAGQTRVRATTLLDGGFGAHGFQMCRKNDDDSDLDLNVDGDDTDAYGKPQYTEADIIPCTCEELRENEAQKTIRAIMRGNSAPNSDVSRSKWLPNGENSPSASTSATENYSHDISQLSEENNRISVNGSTSELIKALKAKIREQEELLKKRDKFKCLICMESYTVPLASIACWHVHCEECWLRTLGSKKLCPQCNMITSPSDLRKIYL